MILSANKRKVVKKKTPKIVKQRPPAVRLYRRIAFSFIILTVLLLALVAYLSFVKATIKIYPVAKTEATDFIVSVVPEAGAINQVEGKIIEKIYEKTKDFVPESEGIKKPAKAGGEVRLINKWTSDQPLVATTRLLSEGGKLFRLDEAVVVPAGGEVKAMVHADEEGEDFEIGPSKFTIPGLLSSKQELIYAQSGQAMTGGSISVKAVTETDLTRAEAELSQEVFDSAKIEISDENSDPRFGRSAYTYEVIEKISDTTPGEEAEKFTIKLKIKVGGVFFNGTQADEISQAKLEEVLEKDYRLAEFDSEKIRYNVQDYTLEEGTANIQVVAEAESVLKENSDILDKKRITGLGLEEAKNLLLGSAAIDNVEISTWPFWVKRIPSLEDHIEYRIIY